MHNHKQIKINSQATSHLRSLPKIHKNEMTQKTPVHLINSPLRPLAQYVLKILSSITVTTNYFVENLRTLYTLVYKYGNRRKSPSLASA
jgi:hypothetical protein